jgi:hypothetical protein
MGKHRAMRAATALIEPQAILSTACAHSLIALQADAIGALASTMLQAIQTWRPISRTTSELESTDKQSSSRFNQVEQSLPDWMADASPTDLTAYSRHLMDLVTVRNQNAGKSYRTGQ